MGKIMAYAFLVHDTPLKLKLDLCKFEWQKSDMSWMCASLDRHAVGSRIMKTARGVTG
jgi:hypothetical protein